MYKRQLSTLVTLSLSNNLLSGSIPTSIGQLANLESLQLFNNILSGSIPGEIGDIPDLEQLLISGNLLTGELPQNLANLTNLTFINVGDNQLTGCYPAGFEIFCGITQFFNVGNAGLFDFDTFCADPMNLAGDGCFTAPTCLDDSLALVALFNATDGPNWTNTWDIENTPYNTWFGVNVNVDGCVTGLNLLNNNLTGTLPTELGDLTSIVTFNVSQNNLTGNLPAELGSWTLLQDFFAGDNNLTGSLPDTYGLSLIHI